jgi:hypothetical protein
MHDAWHIYGASGGPPRRVPIGRPRPSARASASGAAAAAATAEVMVMMRSGDDGVGDDRGWRWSPMGWRWSMEMGISKSKRKRLHAAPGPCGFAFYRNRNPQSPRTTHHTAWAFCLLVVPSKHQTASSFCQAHVRWHMVHLRCIAHRGHGHGALESSASDGASKPFVAFVFTQDECGAAEGTARGARCPPPVLHDIRCDCTCYTLNAFHTVRLRGMGCHGTKAAAARLPKERAASSFLGVNPFDFEHSLEHQTSNLYRRESQLS